VITEIFPVVGVRFVTVDALYDRDTDPAYDASGFYRKLGFDFSDPNESLPPEMPYRTMYYDLKPVLDLLEASTKE
jgi:hypothetical protein